VIGGIGLCPGRDEADAERRSVRSSFAAGGMTPSECNIRNEAVSRMRRMTARRAELIEGLEADAP